MAKFNEVTQRFEWDMPEANSFDWSLYEDGWNGKTLKVNTKVKANKHDKIYCHEHYVDDVYNQFQGVKVVGSKELNKNALVQITDINVIDNNTVRVTINGGANNVIVDLNKEHQFFHQFTVDAEDNRMNKDMFVNALSTSETFKKGLLGMNLTAKITQGDTEKASIWDGYVESFVREMKEQVTKNSKAYIATIISTNRGGFVVNIMDTIQAFMPGSMAAANRVTDFEGMVGTTFEVMVESWDPNYGFVVSRKKFLKTMLPIKIQEIEDALENNTDTVFTGHVTGTTPFGVFVELNEYVTGMLHKTLVCDATREDMRNNAIEAGTEVNVYVHKIEKSKARENGKLVDRYRVILSDVPSSERDEVIAKREAEEESSNKDE